MEDLLEELSLVPYKKISDIFADRLAVGVGDNMIRVCNVDSVTHVSDTITLWQGIKSKVTTVSNCFPFLKTKEFLIDFC